MSDKILIRQLHVDAIIGIHDWEKAQKQPLYIDLDLKYDCLLASKTDDIKDALDYFKVCSEVTAFVGSSRFELIETLAEQITQLLIQRFPVKKVKLKLFKPNAIDNAQTVGLSITRKQP